MKFDIWNFFSEKINYGHFGLYLAENQHFQVGHVLITSLWRHTFNYVIVMSYVDRFFMILVSMERGDFTLYYGTKQLFNFKITGGGNHPN